MTLIPFGKLMNWIPEENKKGAVFGIKRPFIADPDKTYEILAVSWRLLRTRSRTPYPADPEYRGFLRGGRQPFLRA